MSYIVAEYRCAECGVFEVTVNRPAPDDYECECGVSAPWCMSAPKPKVLSVPCYATVRGGDTERRPGMLDTRDLAEGKLTMTQWKAKQREAQRTRRHKMLIDKGITSKKIQV